MRQFTFKPVTPDNWAHFETVMGPRGATGGCWCMYLRLSHADFEAQKGSANKTEMNAIVNSGEVPGILAYVDGQPVGWCSVAPVKLFPG